MTRSRWTSRLASTLGIALLMTIAWPLLKWAFLDASMRPDPSLCQAASHHGACWGVVIAKARPILLGYYPAEAQWRPCLVLALCLVATWAATRPFWLRLSATAITVICSVMVLATATLMRGGVLGLSSVPVDEWGGLPLTLSLFGLSLLLSGPLAIGLALARRASKVWVSVPATTTIEVIRGVPLITLLFMAAFLLPLLLPEAQPFPLFWRATIALTLFSSAYLAEVVRAGLQAVPAEQGEAAAVLGLTWWQTQRRIVLPQALRAVLPALIGHAIGLLKDSSLVMVIGLHELTGGLSLSLGGDAAWRPYYLEAYLFVGLLYGAMCLGLSRLGRKLERTWVRSSA